jgi:hypothetical protein
MLDGGDHMRVLGPPLEESFGAILMATREAGRAAAIAPPT